MFFDNSSTSPDLEGEALDLSLPMRKRALSASDTEASQPSYKKSLIRRYCKFAAVLSLLAVARVRLVLARSRCYSSACLSMASGAPQSGPRDSGSDFPDHGIRCSSDC